MGALPIFAGMDTYQMTRVNRFSDNLFALLMQASAIRITLDVAVVR